ncbi:MAG TPA: glutamate--tRNA ligase [Steroidobacteraceae bacterium]|nr:glutamate--tRNA ligase [Steroidobacteraceae bacterium]
MNESLERAAIALSAQSGTVTRFAPSPSGNLHLGNARTALFSFLLARHAGGRFVLRIEDTDASRSSEVFDRALQDDLTWLGLFWDAGPGREDERGPYRQSQRVALYARHFVTLEARGQVYECFCTPLELEVSRKSQLAAGRPPRYAGTCRDLTPSQRASKRAADLAPTLRFRVPAGERIEFTDFVRGPQSVLSDDIGDFIVRRADGSAAFFFSNAVDDAAMGITHVLRAEDHLTNSPRQILVLKALGLPVPHYGHLSLVVGADGGKLSKRHGATTLREYLEQGFTAAAIGNLLFRLGHSSSENGLLDMPDMVRAFDPAHLGRAPAHFDAVQLRAWQKESVQRMSDAEVAAWLGAQIPAGLDEAAKAAFVEAVRPNVVLPADAAEWRTIVFGDPPGLGAAEQAVIDEAGRAFFMAAAAAAAATPRDFRAIAAATGSAMGRKGKALYQPLRVALTGLTHGPELAPLLRAMPEGSAQARLARFT